MSDVDISDSFPVTRFTIDMPTKMYTFLEQYADFCELSVGDLVKIWLSDKIISMTAISIKDTEQ